MDKAVRCGRGFRIKRGMVWMRFYCVYSGRLELGEARSPEVKPSLIVLLPAGRSSLITHPAELLQIVSVILKPSSEP